MAEPAGPHPLHPQGVPSAEGVLMSGMGGYVTRQGTDVKGYVTIIETMTEARQKGRRLDRRMGL